MGRGGHSPKNKLLLEGNSWPYRASKLRSDLTLNIQKRGGNMPHKQTKKIFHNSKTWWNILVWLETGNSALRTKWNHNNNFENWKECSYSFEEINVTYHWQRWKWNQWNDLSVTFDIITNINNCWGRRC